MEGLLTTREAAEYLGVCPDTVWRYVKRGVLPARRLPSGKYRFEPKVIEDFVTPVEVAEAV